MTISKECVRSANKQLSNVSNKINTNSKGVSVRCKTSFGVHEMNFSRERINKVASDVFKSKK